MSAIEPLVCLECRNEVAPRVVERAETFPVRGEDVAVVAHVAVCPMCGEDIFDEALDADTLGRAFAEYRHRHHLLSPEEIREIRARYGLGQRALSLLLGWGEVTLHRYESGSLQDAAHDTQLRLAADPRNLRGLLAQHGDLLTALQRRKAVAALESLGELGATPITCPAAGTIVAHREVIDERSGFRRFDVDSFREMVLFFSGTPRMFRTKLNKLLFYADFLHFKERTVSISGSPYLAFQRGPVPEHYDRLTADMVESRDLEVEEVLGDGWSGDVFLARRTPDMSLFGPSERRALEHVARCLSGETSTRLSERSHAEAAYLRTDRGNVISYLWARELSLSIVPGDGRQPL